MSETDLELLARYTRLNAEDAFTEIVRRHLDLVHSAALRQVRSPQLAEEVAQATFLKLARAARQLAPDTILAAWLYHVTRQQSVDVVRHEARRQLREQIATDMNAMNATAADWTHIEPLLDEAMHALDETDRAAVLLRYFENKSLREVGRTLGTSDDAAQKRVSRAVERLREFFSQRGVTVGAGALAVIISANSVQAAPVALTMTVSAAAALAETAFTTTATGTATKAIAMTTLQKTLIATAMSAAIGTGIYEAGRLFTAKPVSAPGPAGLGTAGESRFVSISLENAGGKPLASYPPGKDWTAVPQGQQTFGGVPFDVLTKLQLQGTVDATNNRMYPARVIGISVQQRLARLHLFHGANLPDGVGQPIGALRLHYTGGVIHTLFITYGVHVRHWWREYGETDAVRDTNSVLVWSGRSPDSDQKNTTHRLYKSSMDLPPSTQPLESIDVLTLFGDSSYVVLAMTGEAPSAGVPTGPPVPPADETQFRDDLIVKVSDVAGNPIGGARIKGMAINTRAADEVPLARMDDSREEPGTVPVDFPTDTRELRLVASAPGFVARELNLKPIDGKRFTSEALIKLEPGVRIGGFVRDPDGNPIAKAKVEMLRPTHEGSGEVSFFKYEEATSNSQGRWTIREAPESLDNLHFRITHPDFHRGDFEFSGDTGAGNLTREDLLRSRAEFKLAPQ